MLNVNNQNSMKTNFKARVKMLPESPKMTQVSEKLQKIVKNASNQELLAGGTSASAVSEAALATKFPYVAAVLASLNSGLAGSMFTDAKAVRKEMAGKDSLIKQAGDKLAEAECVIEVKAAEIEDLKAENELQQEHINALENYIKGNMNWLQKIFATSFWSK